MVVKSKARAIGNVRAAQQQQQQQQDSSLCLTPPALCPSVQAGHTGRFSSERRLDMGMGSTCGVAGCVAISMHDHAA